MTFSWTNAYVNEALTRETFLTSVRARFDEDSPDWISNLQINQLIEDGLRDISRRTGLYKQSALQTVDGSASYVLPSNLSKLDQVLYQDTDGTERLLIRSNPDEVYSNYDSTVADYYIRYGNTITILGTPVNGNIKITGTKIPEVPVDDSSPIDLPDQYLESIYSWVEWKYWTRRRVPDEAKLARDLYFELIKDISFDVSENTK